MTNTTNYNLLLAEGTDLVNYLTQTNPNFSNLDTIIKGVSDLTVTPATEVTTGTAHAISKTLADATVIKFTATSNWLTGDTMTLDGSPVTPLKTDGTTLKTGDYIIGSAVLMIQDGTRLTVLVASSPDAGDINYDNTVSGLTANKVQGAVDELASEVDTISTNLSSTVLLPPTVLTTSFLSYSLDDSISNYRAVILRFGATSVRQLATTVLINPTVNQDHGVAYSSGTADVRFTDVNTVSIKSNAAGDGWYLSVVGFIKA